MVHRVRRVAFLALVFIIRFTHPAAAGGDQERLLEYSLEELMAIAVREIRGGEMGSYLHRLSEYAGDTSRV